MGNGEMHKGRMLSPKEDMVICKRNVARQQTIRLTWANRETKVITVSLQVTLHFGFLYNMPTAREPPFPIQ